MASPLIYAFGDLHGCLRELDKLLVLIDADADGRPYQLVGLGDYVNRGVDSKGVIDRLVGLQDNSRTYRPVFLKGNHDEAFRRIVSPKFKMSFRALSDKALYKEFVRHGGVETFMSYGCNHNLSSCFRSAATLREAMPGSHRKFFENLPLSFETDTHFFCHAGVDFTRPLDQQTPRDLLWASRAFLASASHAGKVIVHGHTVTGDYKPQVYPNRIAVDTGAYRTGRLTACVLDGPASPRFIMTQP